MLAFLTLAPDYRLAVVANGRKTSSRIGAFGAHRLRMLLASGDSTSLARALFEGPALPESLDLSDTKGNLVTVRLPSTSRSSRAQLWTYSAAGCANCQPMLSQVATVLGATDIDWYHLCYRGDLADGRWPFPGRAPLKILSDDQWAALDAFRVSATPGYVLIGANGRIRSHSSGRGSHRNLTTALASSFPGEGKGIAEAATANSFSPRTLVVFVDASCHGCDTFLATLASPPARTHGVISTFSSLGVQDRDELRRKGWIVQTMQDPTSIERYEISEWPTVLYVGDEAVRRRWSGPGLSYWTIISDLDELTTASASARLGVSRGRTNTLRASKSTFRR